MVLSAKEFNSSSADYLDEMEKSGEPITITKKGRVVAVVTPVPPIRRGKPKGWKSIEGSWAGRIEELGDIVNTHFPWDAAAGK